MVQKHGFLKENSLTTWKKQSKIDMCLSHLLFITKVQGAGAQMTQFEILCHCAPNPNCCLIAMFLMINVMEKEFGQLKAVRYFWRNPLRFNH
jgi:hypothetical protein